MNKETYVEMVCNRIELKIHNHPLMDIYPGPIYTVHEMSLSANHTPLLFSFNGTPIYGDHVPVLENLFYTLMGDDSNDDTSV